MARRTSPARIGFTVPGVSTSDAEAVVTLLQDRLNALSDLALTLKHVHWNVVGPHFIAIDETEESDPVTQDMLVTQAAALEQFQWFVRAHLESADGQLATSGARTESGAAKRASR